MLSDVMNFGNTGAGGNVSGVFIVASFGLLPDRIGQRASGVNSSSGSEPH